jgi:hypothetical protein
MYSIYYIVYTDVCTYSFIKNRRLEIKLTNYELQQLEEAQRRGMNKSELLKSLIARFPAPSKKPSSTALKDGVLKPIL